MEITPINLEDENQKKQNRWRGCDVEINRTHGAATANFIGQ